MWRRAVVAALASIALVQVNADNGCPDGQFSVSILDDPQIKCLASIPCSGVYGLDGILHGIGACPSGTGCALLPHDQSIMGCVAEGRNDVSYVNPDGSLSRNGQIIAGPPKAPDASKASSTGSNANSKAPDNSANTDANPGSNANNANANANTTESASPLPATNLPTPGHVKPGDNAGSSTDTIAVLTPEPSSSAKATTESSSSSSGSGSLADTVNGNNEDAARTNQQNALDTINELTSSKQAGEDKSGMGLGTIIAVVVGCLACVAVVAGVFVLRKNKEEVTQTPVGGASGNYGAAPLGTYGAATTELDDFGAGVVVTPKEEVLLL